jgi:hypothetical protein
VSQPQAGSNKTNLYILSVPSEAVICVAYTYEGNGNQSYEAEFYSTGQSCMCPNCSTPCTGLSGSASPSSLSYDGPTNVTVTYRISASAALAQGLYWLGVGYCEWESFIAGPLPTDVSLNQMPLCSPTAGLATYPPTLVVGVTNITVTQVSCLQFTPVEGCGGVGRTSD